MKHIILDKPNISGYSNDKIRILILSQDQNGIELLNKVLEEKYILYKPKTISEAFEILCHEEIALVIADNEQSEINTWDFLESVMYLSKNSIRILLSNYDDLQKMTDKQSEGIFQYHLGKPLAMNMVSQVIWNAMELYKINEKVKTLSEDLEIANKMIELRKKEYGNFEEQKKRFMLIANHELRTPATIISSSLDILNSKQNHFDETEKQLLVSAKTGASWLNDTLEKIYTMLNDKGEMVYTDDFRLSEILSNLQNNINEHLQKRNISLKITCPDSVTMPGQKQKIISLFDNLLSNAIKFTHNNGVVIIEVIEKNSNIFVSIKDNGIGIPANEQNNIFKSFYQLGNLLNHHSSKYDFLGKGTGLGLSICKNIVEQHSGEIWVESEGENRGSKINIKFPNRNNNIIGLPLHKLYAKAV